MKRIVGLILAAVIAVFGLALAGCSTVQTHTSQCGWVIGNGFQQNHGVKQVLYPNDNVNKGHSDQAYFVPCNSRNYIVTPDQNSGDRHDPAVAMTNAANNLPAVQVNVYLSAHWTLNEDKNTLIDFWAFCQKYSCQSTEQNDNSANNSTPGWNSMLAENMSPAINRAVVDAVQEFPPTLWADQSQWPKLGQAVGKYILNELRASTGVNRDFFCADGSDTRNGGKCLPPTFTVEKVDPVNGNLRSIQNQQSEMDAQSQQNAQRVAQAKQLYGDYWAYALMIQDTINACHAAGQNCTVVLGNGQPAVTTK